MSILIFNNRIYGLTKGQYSPTTPKGSVTKTSPEGSIEEPFNPGELVMGSQGSFFARVVDTDVKMMKEVFVEAASHKGTAVVEVLQNCVIFNNDVHDNITGKEVKGDHQIYLKHGEPMIFGKNRDKGLILKNNKFEVVTIGENGITEKDIMIHDAKSSDAAMHYNLIRLDQPEYPMAMGIIRAVSKTVYEDMLYDQIAHSNEKNPVKCMDDLLKSGNIFEINEGA